MTIIDPLPDGRMLMLLGRKGLWPMVWGWAAITSLTLIAAFGASRLSSVLISAPPD